MYRGNKDKSAMNHWFEWVSKGKEELFEDIYKLVEDMIKEMTPQLIKEYLIENPIPIDVKPSVENDLKAKIEEAITKALK